MAAYDRFAFHTARRRDFTSPGAETSYAPDLALEPVQMHLELAFDIDQKTVAGTVTTTVRGNRTGARTLQLDAVDFDDVLVSGPDEWRYDGEKIHLTWKDGFAKDETRKVAVTYRVVDPVSGLFFRVPNDAYPNRAKLCFSDHETERARHWLPCVDYPTVRTTLAFDLTAPAGMTILANGELVENADGRAVWRLDQPCPSYLCCVAIGDFVRYDDETVDGTPISYFAPAPYTPEQLHLAFGGTPAMLRWITKRLRRPFPYPKYYQFAAPGIGGAMENISLVSWDSIFVCDETLDREWGDLVDAINIHEMAHTYFGDDVVCRHFDHAWLKESWAVYIETAFWEETVGRDEGHYDFFRNMRLYMTEADERYVRPLVTRTYNTSWDMYDMHLYPGGACRLHMLRHMVGDEAFWNATAEYLERYSGKVVETADLRQIMEAHSGLNLTKFFDQWIYGKGYPKLKANYSHDAESNVATITVEQTQVDDKKGVGLFDLDLEVAIEDDGGWTTHTIALSENRHVVQFATNGKPKQVRFDPETKAMFRLEFQPGLDMLTRTLREAPDVVSRIRAAEALIDKGTRKGIAAVREAMAKEPYYGVRETVATALSKAPAPGVAEALADMLEAEKDPRIHRTLARACGTFRDPALRDALRRYLDRDGLPRWGRASALASLGAQRDTEDLARLEEATREEDLHRISAGGAYGGLAQFREPRALERLLAVAPYGVEDERSRKALVRAIGASAARQARDDKDRAADVLIDLTRDPETDIAMIAAGALAGLGLPRAAGPIANVRRRVSAQDAVDIDRHAARASSGGPGAEVATLRERFEKLEEKNRKLEQRLQDLEAKHDKKE